MAYPPTVPSGARINTTPQVDTHPADHVSIHAALTDIINELGSNPSGDAASVTALFELLCPIQEVKWIAGSVPSGWHLCDGAVLDQATYPDLFAAIGTTFNTGGEAGTEFRLPNLVDKYAIGASGAVALGAQVGSNDAVVVEHTHDHTLAAPAHTHTAGSLAIDSSARFGASQGFLGTGSAGTNDYSVDFGTPTAGGTYGFTMSTSDIGLIGTSGGASATALTGSIDTEGVSGTNANRPASLGLNPIIRLS